MKTGTYKVSDYWSFGTFLYEMIAGKRPSCNCAKKTPEWCPFGQKRQMEENALRDDGILRIEVEYPTDKFSPEAKDLFDKLFMVDPKKRLGANGVEEIKQHPYFSQIDWSRLTSQQIDPPFVPDTRTVNAVSIGEVGEFNKGKFKKVKLTPDDEKQYESFTWLSDEWVQEELTEALRKQDNPPPQPPNQQNNAKSSNTSCCSLM